MRRSLTALFVATIAFAAASAAIDRNSPAPRAATPPGTEGALESIRGLPAQPLDAAETAALLYLREEEKLARDVYLALDAAWDLRIFEHISASEQRHADAVLELLLKYGIADPVGTNGRGVFTNEALQGLHDTLVARGRASMVDALRVGATIEDLDLANLARDRALTDNQDVLAVLDNLARGSRNHLRAFYGRILANGATYASQYLDQATFGAIVNAPREIGSGPGGGPCTGEPRHGGHGRRR